MRKLALLVLLLVPIGRLRSLRIGGAIFIIDAPDPDLAALLQTCLNSAAVHQRRPVVRTCRPSVSPCAGGPLSWRATPRRRTSMTCCNVNRVADGGSAVEVYVSFDTCS